MYGWRAKLGFIVPANNSVIEPEMYRILPEGVSLHFTKVRLMGAPNEQLDLGPAVDLLKCGGMDVIVYACMAGSLTQTKEWETLITHTSGVPALSASTALINALSGMAAKNIAVATHYPQPRLAEVKRWFEQNRLSVVSSDTAELNDPKSVCNLPAESVYQLAKKANNDRAEVVCLVATDLRTFPILQMLENDLGKPVISSNQAILWCALRLAGIKSSIEGYGSLFRY
jgi:maleate isomerase